MAEIGLFEAMYSQRSIRRYKPDPVPDELIRKVIEAATKAPSAINRQPWAFIVVRDKTIKDQLCMYYRKAWDMGDTSEEMRKRRAAENQKIISSAAAFARHIQDVPVLILVCMTEPNNYTSVLPATQNLMLAARGLGLGTIITTLHKRYEKEVKQVVGVPDNVEIVCIVPLGWPDTNFGATRRKPVEEVIFYDRWQNRQP